MALWIRDGFELYNAISDGQTGTGYGLWDTATSYGLSNQTRFGLGHSISSAAATVGLRKTGFTNTATAFGACAQIFPQALSSTANDEFAMSFYDGSTAQVTVTWGWTGIMNVYRGAAGGTLLGTFSGAFLGNQWNQFQIKVVIDPTAGEVHIRKNGNTVDDFALTGVNTRNSANSQVNACQLSCAASANLMLIDDLAFWDNVNDGTIWHDWVGDFRIVAMPPISDNSVQFTQNNAGSTTFGTSSTASSRSRAANTIFLFPFTPTCGGSLGSLTVDLAAGMTGHMQCALYDSDGDNVSWDSTPASFNQPGTLLYQTNAVTNPVSGANAFTWTATPYVQNKHKYYLAVWMDAAATINDNNASTAGQWSYALAYGSFPSTLQNLGATLSTQVCSVHCAITPTNAGMVNDYSQDGSTTYLTDSNVGDTDFYNLLGLSFTPASILGVDVVAVVSKSDSGSRGLTVELKSGATTQSYAQIVPNTSFNWTRYRQDTDPNTGSAWTPTALNNALLGQKLTL